MFFQFGPMEQSFLLGLILSLICGFSIGSERELRGKPAGISTQTLIIGAAMLFTSMSRIYLADDPTRIAAQIVSGVGFLGAGIIFRSQVAGNEKVKNLTTAASIWFSAAIGMALGFELYTMAVIATVYAVLIAHIPKLYKGDYTEN